jgi:hypothetical protein
MLLTFSASALSLIILPKVIAYRRAIRDGDERKHTIRGSGGTGSVVVSGLPSNRDQLPPQTATETETDS